MACQEPHREGGCTCDTCGESVSHQWRTQSVDPSWEGGHRSRVLASAECPNGHSGAAVNLPRPSGT